MYGPILDLISACLLLSCCILQARGLICRGDVICDEEESAGPLCGSDGITYGMENYGLLNLYCEIIGRRTGRLASASQPYMYERVPNISQYRFNNFLLFVPQFLISKSLTRDTP